MCGDLIDQILFIWCICLYHRWLRKFFKKEKILLSTCNTTVDAFVYFLGHLLDVLSFVEIWWVCGWCYEWIYTDHGYHEYTRKIFYIHSVYVLRNAKKSRYTYVYLDSDSILLSRSYSKCSCFQISKWYSRFSVFFIFS